MRRALGVIVLAVIALAALFWLGFAVGIAVDTWRDNCALDEFSCDYGTADDVLALFQLVVALAGAALAGLCCAGGIRMLVTGKRVASLRRAALIALGIFAFWFLGPFTLIAINNA